MSTRHPFSLEGVLALLEQSAAGRTVGKPVLMVVPDTSPPDTVSSGGDREQRR